MLIGGEDPNHRSLSSVELLGLDNCSVPDLPEWRNNHGSFMTEWGSLAVCGGRWAGKPMSSDCLVLNTTSKQWERGLLGQVLGDIVVGVIRLSVGTLMVHHKNSSLLPSGEHKWIAGPSSPEVVQCATGISEHSYLAFGDKFVQEFDSRTGPNTNEGWRTYDDWPKLEVTRYRPGCATLDAPEPMCIIAGGRDEQYERLKSVEIIFLSQKSRKRAQDMLTPRSHFNLVVLSGIMLLAFGGSNETSVEVWEGIDGPWSLTNFSLANARTQFSAFTTTDLVCSDGPLPPHSCPTVDGGSCVFPFKNGKSIC